MTDLEPLSLEHLALLAMALGALMIAAKAIRAGDFAFAVAFTGFGIWCANDIRRVRNERL